MAINQKDMIVAFSNIWSTYLILRYLKNQHIGDKRNSYVILLGLTIGLGLGIRIVFVSILLPIIVISILDILFFKNITSKNFSYKKLIFDVILSIMSIKFEGLRDFSGILKYLLQIS